MSDVAPPSVEAIYGPMFIGMFCSTILYGVTLVQTAIYFGRYRDPAWIRYFVIYLFMAETLSTVLFFEMLYEPLIAKAGLPDIQILSPLLLPSDGPVTALIATPVQFLMAWRIKSISDARIGGSTIKVINRSTIMPFIICIFYLASLAGGIWLGVSVAQKPRFANFVEFKGAPALWLVSAAVADVLIAGTMVLLLVKRKSSVGPVMKLHIDRIVRFTVQTGTLTAVAALADALLFLTLPHTTIFFIWDLSLSKLYTNTILSSLNARAWKDPTGDQFEAMKSLLFAPNLNTISGTSTSISLNDGPRTPGGVRSMFNDYRSRLPEDSDIELGPIPTDLTSNNDTKLAIRPEGEL